MPSRSMTLIIALACLDQSHCLADPPAKAPDENEAIRKGIAFVETKSLTWLREKKCASCHHVSMMAWVQLDAQLRGFKIDEKGLQEATNFLLAADNIERERIRLPEVASGKHAMVDPDCPCCQMAADMPGVMIWGLDGSGMDDDFAFDIYHRTRAEWEAEQLRTQELNRRFDAEWEERKRLGVTGAEATGEYAIWKSSFAIGDAAGVPLGVRLFGIGCRLAELIADIRSAAGVSEALPAQQFIDQLNRDFGNLREILQNSGASPAEALIDPVIERFSSSLSELESVCPDLAEKCQLLTSSLFKFLDPDASDPPMNEFGDEIPF